MAVIEAYSATSMVDFNFAQLGYGIDYNGDATTWSVTYATGTSVDRQQHHQHIGWTPLVQNQTSRGRFGVARRILALFDSGADETIRQSVRHLRAEGADNDEIVRAIDAIIGGLPAFSCDNPPAHSMCRRCQLPLVTGPGTGHRSHRLFCSDRCRKAHRRANQTKVAA